MKAAPIPRPAHCIVCGDKQILRNGAKCFCVASCGTRPKGGDGLSGSVHDSAGPTGIAKP